MLGMMSSCGSSEDSALSFIESGKALLAEGNTDKARVEFKNAIQVDPRRAEPFYQLALMDEKEQKWKAMFANLTTVEQLDPNHHEAIVKLGQMHLLAGNIDQAQEKAEKVLQADSQNIQAIVLQASIYLKQKNFGSALNTVEKALAIDSDFLEALSVKILANKDEGNIDEALIIANKTLQSHPDALPVKMIKLSILEQQKEYASMESLYRELLVTYPNKNWVVVSLAKLLNNALDRYDDAKKELKTFIVANPNDAEAKLLLVALVKTKEPLEAITLLDSYVKADPENYDLRFSKIDLLSKQNDTKGVIADLQQIVVDDSNGENGRKAKVLLAEYEAAQGNFDQAELMVTEVLETSSEDEAALLLKAKLELKNNNTDTAISDLRLVLRNNPESDKAYILLAQAYIASGSQALAEDSFREALIINPRNIIAALFIANSAVEENDLEQAEKVLLTALSGNPTQEALLQALAQVRISKKDWAGTETAISSLGKSSNDSAFFHYLAGQLDQGQSDFSSAIEQYKLALSKKPSIEKALQGLATSYMQMNDKEGLINYLNQFINSYPKQLHGYSVLASIYRQGREWQQAITTIDKGLEIEPSWIGGYGAIAIISYIQGDNNGAIESYKAGLVNNPENEVLSMQLASAYESVADYENAKSLYESILIRSTDNEPAINNLASLLTDQFQSEENLQKALQLSSRFNKATEPYYRDTYAWVNVNLGNLEQAQIILESVVSLRPSVAVFNYHLGVLYAKQADHEQAKKYLEQANQLATEQGDDNLRAEISKVLGSL